LPGCKTGRHVSRRPHQAFLFRFPLQPGRSRIEIAAHDDEYCVQSSERTGMLPAVRTTSQKPRIAAAILRLSGIALLAGCLLAPNDGLLSMHWSLQLQGVAGDKRIIKVDVALVTVPVVVTDSKGNYVPGLKEIDFRIFENDQAQRIDRLIPTTEPFHVALMLDRSGSTTFKYEDIQSAALAFVDALRPQDRFLIGSPIIANSRMSVLGCEPRSCKPTAREAEPGCTTPYKPS
jgi:hypothetical protein